MAITSAGHAYRNSPARWNSPRLTTIAMQLEKSAQRRALHNRYDHIRAFNHALTVVRTNSSLKQAGCGEFFPCTHHLFPHLIRVPFLVEKCGSLLPGHGAAMLVGQSQQMRKCDFGHHSVSVLFLRHSLCPRRRKIVKKGPVLLWLVQ